MLPTGAPALHGEQALELLAQPQAARRDVEELGTQGDARRLGAAVSAPGAHRVRGRRRAPPEGQGSGSCQILMKEDRVTQQTYGRETERTGWTGWITFAGVMLIIGGSLGLIFGIIVAVNDNWVVFTNRGNVSIDLSTWGWVHIIVGAVVVLAGFGVFTGNILARIVGVAVAVVSLIANFLWLPVYPLWAIIIITIDALVIWALTAHGGEMRNY